jgi:hypothetical protein
VAVTTTGNPVAIASKTEFDIPSVREDETYTSIAFSSSGTELLLPRNVTRSFQPVAIDKLGQFRELRAIAGNQQAPR